MCQRRPIGLRKLRRTGVQGLLVGLSRRGRPHRICLESATPAGVMRRNSVLSEAGSRPARGGMARKMDLVDLISSPTRPPHRQRARIEHPQVLDGD
jgi:hypothetical protein